MSCVFYKKTWEIPGRTRVLQCDPWVNSNFCGKLSLRGRLPIGLCDRTCNVVDTTSNLRFPLVPVLILLVTNSLRLDEQRDEEFSRLRNVLVALSRTPFRGCPAMKITGVTKALDKRSCTWPSSCTWGSPSQTQFRKDHLSRYHLCPALIASPLLRTTCRDNVVSKTPEFLSKAHWRRPTRPDPQSYRRWWNRTSKMDHPDKRHVPLVEDFFPLRKRNTSSCDQLLTLEQDSVHVTDGHPRAWKRKRHRLDCRDESRFSLSVCMGMQKLRAACPQNIVKILTLHDVENLHLLSCHWCVLSKR